MAPTYKLIASNTLGSATAAITFSAIPATYTDLVLGFTGRATAAGTADALFGIRINTDTSTLYSTTFMYGSGSAGYGSSRSTDGNSIVYAGTMSAATATADTFGSAEIYIPDYTASQNRAIYTYSAAESNQVSADSWAWNIASAGLYRSTTAITSITVSPYASASNFVAGSSFFLYGVKNS